MRDRFTKHFLPEPRSFVSSKAYEREKARVKELEAALKQLLSPRNSRLDSCSPLYHKVQALLKQEQDG